LIGGSEKGTTRADMLAARNAGRKGERIVHVRPLVGQAPATKRAITPGQHL
jgi:hypothetical protein